MLKRNLILLFLFILLLGCKKNNKTENELTIYTYSSLNWITDTVIKTFEQQNSCSVKVNSDFTDTGDMVSKAILEKDSPRADIIMGLTPSFLITAKKNDILIPYKSINIDNIKNPSLIFDIEYYTTPYDYGALAIVYNPDKVSNLNKFSDLYKSKNCLVIQDPRTSSPGLDFLLWTIAIYGDEWENEWTRLKNGILTVTSGWSEAFAKFEAGEAPMMLSYATDSAYTFHNYQVAKNKIFIPEEGGYIQIEGASIIKNTKNLKLAKKFIDFMLTEAFQKEIPLNQWMFPVIETDMPKAFKYAVNPEKTVTVDEQTLKKIPEILEKWEKLFY